MTLLSSRLSRRRCIANENPVQKGPRPRHFISEGPLYRALQSDRSVTMRILRPLVLTVLAMQLGSSSLAFSSLQFYTVTPCRLVDTRDPVNPQGNGGPIIDASTARDFPIFGPDARPCGVPSGAKAAVLNLVVVGPTSAGHIIAYQYGYPSIPLVSNLNFDANEPALANGALIELGQDALRQLTVWTAMSPGATAHLVIDVTGYYE